eukprot:5469889-Pleurochrysis_carterae.AAC.2
MSGEGKTLGLFGRARGARARDHPARATSRLPIRERCPLRWVELVVAPAQRTRHQGVALRPREQEWRSEAARVWAAATCRERVVAKREP